MRDSYNNKKNLKRRASYGAAGDRRNSRDFKSFGHRRSSTDLNGKIEPDTERNRRRSGGDLNSTYDKKSMQSLTPRENDRDYRGQRKGSTSSVDSR